MIGKRLDHFEICGEVGEGSMGEVYLAQDLQLDRIVALKLLPKRLVSDEQARRRLIREARAASKLRHPNIVTIYSVETSGERDYIVMEYVEGISLASFIQLSRRPADQVIGIGIQLARGLEHAHRAGVLHRDLKPANIMLDYEGRVRILDFGLARTLDSTTITEPGAMIGTPLYMSPEQVRGEHADARADLWSLGAVLYELMTGQRAFPGTLPASVYYAILNESPKKIREIRPDAPQHFAAAIELCLEKQISDRAQSANEVLEILEKGARDSVPAARSAQSKFTHQGLTIAEKSISVIALAVIAILIYFIATRGEAIAPARMLVVEFSTEGSVPAGFSCPAFDLELAARLHEAGFRMLAPANTSGDSGLKEGSPNRRRDVDYVVEGVVLWGEATNARVSVRVLPRVTRTEDSFLAYAGVIDDSVNTLDALNLQSQLALRVSNAIVHAITYERQSINLGPTLNP